jgi:pSer/pThr/pTyr-binding forkhead associated (FHA) protein
MSERGNLDGRQPSDSDWSLVGTDATFNLAGPKLRVGRALDCDVVLDHPSVSRHHATVTFQAGRPRLEDAMSRHGTQVNGQKIDGAIELNHGDRVAFGGAAFIVRDRRQQQRAQRDTLQVPVLTASSAKQILRESPVTGEHDPVSAMLTEIQLLVDDGEGARAASLIAGLLKSWSAQAASQAIDEGTLRRGSAAILRVVGPDQASWTDTIVALHHKSGVLIHASTLDQLEAAIRRAPRIDWRALEAYAQWLRTSRIALTRGEYGSYCVQRLEQIVRARR